MSEDEKTEYRAIVMRTGVTHWVEKPDADRIKALVLSENPPKHAEIEEKMISLASIEGIYTIEEFDDLARIKQGMWQCGERTWHKRKDECDCQREMAKKRHQEEQAAREREMNKELTPEERERARQRMAEITESLRNLKNKA